MQIVISGYNGSLLFVDLDAQGGLNVIEKIPLTDNLSFLCFVPRLNKLYGVQEQDQGRLWSWEFSDSLSDTTRKSVDSYDVARFAKGNQFPVGHSPCHLVISPNHRWLAVANYGDGSVDLFSLDNQGKPGLPAYRAIHRGKGPREDRQEGPHAHGVTFCQDSSWLYVCDLGIDQILGYPIPLEKPGSDSGTGILEGSIAYSAQPGDGPRHMILSDHDQFAYGINELSCTIDVLSHDTNAHELRQIQRVSTLPPGVPVSQKITAAEIMGHPSGRFLYCSNRGYDTVVCYPRNSETGFLSQATWYSTGGSGPRHFFFDSSGSYLFVANQFSNEVRSFLVDEESGALEMTGFRVEVEQPTFGMVVES